MEIKIGNTILCAGTVRNSNGEPVGPDGLTVAEVPGIAKRDYIGADRTVPEHVKCNHGTVSFSVTRIFPSVDAALDYALGGIYEEDVEGTFTCGGRTVFEHAAVTNRQVSHVGCAVAVAYTIEG